MLAVRSKDLPKHGFLGHLRSKLFQMKIWEIKVEFTNNVENLGCSYHDHYRNDVSLFTNDGLSGGWHGSYGASYATMYSNDVSAQAAGGKVSTNVPTNCAILDITVRRIRTAKVYINPEHQSKLLKEPPTGIDIARVKKILDVFGGLKASYRQDPLHNLKVSDEELSVLVDRGWIKCHKGKLPVRLEKPIYVNGPCMFKYYNLGGAKITTDGKNIRSSN